MKIVRARIKSIGSPAEFITVKGRIKGVIQKNQGEEFDFVVESNGKKFIKSFGPDNIDKTLVNKQIPIDSTMSLEFCKNGIIKVLEGALPKQTSVNQLKRLRKQTKGTDIGDRAYPPNYGQIANMINFGNPIDRIESYEDFHRKNKRFVPSWNLKGMLTPWK